MWYRYNDLTSSLGNVEKRVAALSTVERTQSEDNLLRNLNLNVQTERKLSERIPAERGEHDKGSRLHLSSQLIWEQN